jgi:hypothetical protein
MRSAGPLPTASGKGTEQMRRTPTWLRGALSGVICLAVALPAGAKTVGIDARHGYSADSILATSSSFSIFRNTIVSAGHTIVPKASFNAGDLAGLDALILNQPYEQNSPAGFSAGERTAIHEFVAEGGGLMVHAEGGRGFLHDNLRSLVNPYGISYLSRATCADGRTVTGFVPHPVTAGLTSIGVDYQRRLTRTDWPAIRLTIESGSYEDNVLAAVNGVGGSGNIVFLTDTGLWHDPDPASDRPITFGDNLLLLENAVAFITIPEPATVVLMALGGLAVVRRRKR